MSDEVMQVLDEARCWQLLEAHEYGRLAFAVANEPDITPINYCARDHKLYMRTAAGSKLMSVTINQKIAFEFDQVGPHQATSVIAYGSARRLEDPDEREFFETLPLRPWVASEKSFYLEISIDAISGRTYQLGR